MIVVSLGGIASDDTTYHMALEQPFSQPALKLERTNREGNDPLVTRARRESMAMGVRIWVFGANEDAVRTNREALLAALDTDDAAIALVVADDDGGNERYRHVVTQAIDEQDNEQGPGQFFVVTLVTHGETRWRSTTATSQTWNVADSGDTVAVANGGSLLARPVYTIQPTAAKSGAGNAFAYRMFSAVKWPGRAASHYPINLTDEGSGGAWDTAALTPAKLSGETNIAVMVDGRMVRRWLNSYDDTNTDVWVNLDWQEYFPAFLLTSIGAGDTIDTITASSDISSYPRSGILQIDDELFTYADKDEATNTFTGVVRAARGSTAAAHTGAPSAGGDEIHWIQHDIWILYGGTGVWVNTYDLSGPDSYAYAGDDIYKPMITLGFSTNAQWVFNEFAEGGVENTNRSASWRRYGATGGTDVEDDPYSKMIVTNPTRLGPVQGVSGWELRTAYYVDFMSIFGEAQNFEPGIQWSAGIYYPDNYGGSVTYLPISDPVSPDGNPVSFSLLVTADSGSNEALRFEQRSSGAMLAAIDGMSIQWLDPPTAMMGPEIAAYDLALTLRNVTTGESITLTLPMALGEQLEVNTDNHTVTLLDDGTSQYQALSRSTRRQEILKLVPGNNTLEVTEDGLDAVTIFIEFEERTYS